jgi:hypothetical protein
MPPITGVACWLVPPFSSMTRPNLLLIPTWVQVPSWAPFFGQKLLAFCFSPSPIGYTESFSFSLSLLLLHGSPRMSLRVWNRHVVHSSPPFVALYAHRFYSPRCEPIPLGCLGAHPLPISHPGVYHLNAPYHRRSLMARAPLFFDDHGQAQSLAHTHVEFKSHRTTNPDFCSSAARMNVWNERMDRQSTIQRGIDGVFEGPNQLLGLESQG